MEHNKTFQNYSEYEEKVKALDVAKVNAAMRKHFNLKKFELIYAGDFAKK